MKTSRARNAAGINSRVPGFAERNHMRNASLHLEADGRAAMECGLEVLGKTNKRMFLRRGAIYWLRQSVEYLNNPVGQIELVLGISQEIISQSAKVKIGAKSA